MQEPSIGASTAGTHLFPTYRRRDVVFVRGEGAWLEAADGRRYLDFGSGVAVNALGHAHPHLVAALTAQAEKLWHVSNLYRVDGQERLADRLCAATFADRVFFTNSGAEAVECAIKLARRYHWTAGAPERTRLITFEGAFHGRTLATIAAGGQAKYLEGFGTPLEGFDQVPFGDLEAVEAAIGPLTAGILLEPVQGEGGVRVFPGEMLRTLRALCDARGLLLVLDEVQTGVGRTGHLFAHERAGISPDIMAIAKGIGGGFPLGACLATERVAAAMGPGTHGSTFGGNPLAMAVGSAVLDIVLEPGFLTGVQLAANRLRQGLAALADQFPRLVAEVRGEGLLIGLKLNVPNTDLIDSAFAEGLLAVAAGDNVVRLLPPLIIGEPDIEAGLARLEAALARLDRKDG
ncbi:MAG: aspartate aminotransferase family protein [Alphaproteobacteria bacterium]|nr:aspartate aminotransferase family protein [Alphaproteobacteria bacterium]